MPLLTAPLAAYAQLAAHAALCTFVLFISSLLSLPALLINGLHTYLHPDTLPGAADGIRAAIRRPSDTSSDQTPANLRRRSRSAKDGYGGRGKSAFDEAGAQLLRLRLLDSHLRTRLYFPEYCRAFTATAIAFSSLILGRLLLSDSSVMVATVVPAIISLLACSHIFFSLAMTALERSATKRSERQLATLCGIVGFFLVLVIRHALSPSVFDFGSGGGQLGLWGTGVSAFAGCLSGFLFVPATRAARSLWLGTDQLRWNLEVISCGTMARILLHVSYIVSITAPSMWIRPFREFPARNTETDKLGDFRVWLLAVSSALRFVDLRTNVQTYLNEAVLCWYQRLHASKFPDLDFGRAKVFLHNHYLCLVVQQFFAAPALQMLLLGLSQMRGNSLLLGDFSSVAKETALFLAWWVGFIWAVYTTFTLLLLRWGVLLIS